MNHLRRCGAIVATLAAATCCTPAEAYYDDVHYAVTYYVARRVGYTPIQAHRVASAAVRVDYSERTEPVQSVAPPFTMFQSSQEPRWRFHAFRNELAPDLPDGQFGDYYDPYVRTDAQDRLISEQQLCLFRDAVKHRNPGVLIHFTEDRVPHARYASVYGHWDPFATQVDLSKPDGTLPQGGTTDWLLYRDEAAAFALFEDTAFKLSYYLRKAGNNRQRPNAAPLDEHAREVIRAVRHINRPLPPQLGFGTPSINQVGGFKLELKIAQTVASLPKIESVEQLESEEIRDQYPQSHRALNSFPRAVRQHAIGTNLRNAIGVINDGMKVDEMTEYRDKGTMPIEILPYEVQAELDRDGDHFDPDRRDEWVIFGDLTVRLATSTPAPAEVTVWLEPTHKHERRYRLIDPPAQLAAGQREITFERLPLGEIEVEIVSNGRSKKEPLTLDREKRTIDIELDRPLKKKLEYVGLARDGNRLYKPNDVIEGSSVKVLESSARMFIELDTGTVGGAINFARQREPGSAKTDRIDVKFFSHVPYGWQPPESARGTVIVRGDARYEAVNEDGREIWSDAVAVALYRGSDVAVPDYPEFRGHFIVVYNQGKPTPEVVAQILSAERKTLPPGVLAVLLAVEP